MLYFAPPCSDQVRAAQRAGLIGAMTTPDQGNSMAGYPVRAGDNGCFGKGWPGDDGFARYLDKLARSPGPWRFVVAPDVVCDAAATAARSAPWLDEMDRLGLPIAYVAQNGVADCPPPWERIKVLFVGGDTDWKFGPESVEICGEARARGISVHLGRANSRRRMVRAVTLLGADSADGTYPRFRPPGTGATEVLDWCSMLF